METLSKETSSLPQDGDEEETACTAFTGKITVTGPCASPYGHTHICMLLLPTQAEQPEEDEEERWDFQLLLEEHQSWKPRWAGGPLPACTAAPLWEWNCFQTRARLKLWQAGFSEGPQGRRKRHFHAASLQSTIRNSSA